MPETPRNVLFLCHGNSARSLTAEAIVNREGRGLFRGFSAGADPAGGPHPRAMALLQHHGHDISGLRTKSRDDFAAPGAPEMDFVVTLCDASAAEPCPVWPGRPVTAHWGVPDPAAATGGDAAIALAFSDAYRMLQSRIAAFVTLPMDRLDRPALQDRIDRIGREGARPPTPPRPA